MTDTAELTYELLKKLHGEFAEFRRDMASLKVRVGSLEQHYAATAVDIARINIELDDIRGRLGRIEQRLNLVEA